MRRRAFVLILGLAVLLLGASFFWLQEPDEDATPSVSVVSSSRAGPPPDATSSTSDLHHRAARRGPTAIPTSDTPSPGGDFQITVRLGDQSLPLAGTLTEFHGVRAWSGPEQVPDNSAGAVLRGLLTGGPWAPIGWSDAEAMRAFLREGRQIYGDKAPEGGADLALWAEYQTQARVTEQLQGDMQFPIDMSDVWSALSASGDSPLIRRYQLALASNEMLSTFDRPLSVELALQLLAASGEPTSQSVAALVLTRADVDLSADHLDVLADAYDGVDPDLHVQIARKGLQLAYNERNDEAVRSWMGRFQQAVEESCTPPLCERWREEASEAKGTLLAHGFLEGEDAGWPYELIPTTFACADVYDASACTARISPGEDWSWSETSLFTHCVESSTTALTSGTLEVTAP